MSKIDFDNDNTRDRLMYLQSKCDYPECNFTPLTLNDIAELKIGFPCYVISGSGLNLVMFVGSNKNLKTKEPELEFYTRLGSIKYKATNLCKTYNVYKATV